MKRRTQYLVAAAAMAAAMGATAQDAECNAGSAWGVVKPGCGSSGHTQSLPWGGHYNNSGNQVPPPGYAQGPNSIYIDPATGMVVPQGRVWVDRNGDGVPDRAQRRRGRDRDRDRDGDGVLDRHDRYPYDARYR